ncbi:MAG: arginine--tRNA ligase, partial [Proteobacteria bacterium]|nr:arginine--tRNA ligase [Pseudomonadota bacterium]
MSIVEALVASGDLPAGLDSAKLSVEPPRDPQHGDLSTNAAMVLAKPAGIKPRDLAAIIAEQMTKLAGVGSVEIAGPGFINARLKPEFWHARLGDVLETGVAYGDSKIGADQPVNVEYVSANPTGPLHVAHARGAVVGDALVNLLRKAGFAVTAEYYINDAGAQVDQLGRSAHLRYREALGEAIGDIPEGLYPGDYMVPIGEELAAVHGDRYVGKPESEWLGIFRDVAVERLMVRVKEDLAALGIHQDV